MNENCDELHYNFLHLEHEYGNPILFDDDMNVLIGDFGLTHGEFKKEIPMEDKIYFLNEGRIWLDNKIISFWNYPEKGNFFELINNIKNKLDKKILNNNWLVEIPLKTNKDEDLEYYLKYYGVDLNHIDKNKNNILIPIEKYEGTEPPPEEHKIRHLMNLKQKGKMKKSKYFGSKSKKDIERGEWTHARTKYMGENIVPFKLFETPDNPYNTILDVDDEDARGFVILYKDNKLIYSELYAVEGHIKFNSIENDIEYNGRLWREGKLISFWNYPNPNRLFNEILPELEKLSKRIEDVKYSEPIKFDNEWLIEVIYDENGEIPFDKNYPNEDASSRSIVPLNDYSKNIDYEDKHEDSPLLKKNIKKSKYFGSKSKKDIERGEWTHAKTKYMGEKLKIKKIDEVCDYLKNYDNISVDYIDGIPFKYEIDDDIYIDYGNFGEAHDQMHSRLPKDGRIYYPIEGFNKKLLDNNKILTFWHYPPKEKWKIFLDELVKKFNNYINETENMDLKNIVLDFWDDDWLVEIPIHPLKGKNYIDDETIDNYVNYYGIDKSHVDDDNTYILIPLEKYEGTEPPPEEHKIRHLMDLKQKEKMKKSKYFGSKSKKDIERGEWTYARTKYMGESNYEIFTYDKFWGRIGGGVLPIAKSTKRILVPYRSKFVNEPRTWGLWGGKVDEEKGESEKDIKEVVKREFLEETEYKYNIELHQAYIFNQNGFRYYNFIGIIDNEFDPILNWETEYYEWMTFDELLELEPKHFGLKELLEDEKTIKLINEILEKI